MLKVTSSTLVTDAWNQNSILLYVHEYNNSHLLTAFKKNYIYIYIYMSNNVAINNH